MCSIFGWIGIVSSADKIHIIANANERGRDGYGFWVDGVELRGIGDISLDHRLCILSGFRVLGNFRATPTTEAESLVEFLQPYDGIVHNGVIANDKSFGNFPIDSMALPTILKERAFDDNLLKALSTIKGSYALAYFWQGDLVIAVNYKPVYFVKRDQGFLFASTPDMLPDYSTPVKPYSVMKIDLWLDIETLILYRKQNKKVLVSASSGLDSTTVAFMLTDQEYDVTLVYFRYGCLAEDKELDRIKKIAEYGGFDLVTLDMPAGVMRGTIVEGTYHEDAIEGVEYAMDWVSARNVLMLAMLTSYAESNDYGYIAFGGNLEESGAYPDNEQEFGRKFNELLPYCTQNGVKVELLQPLCIYMKHEIVKIGVDLNVPYHLTWSCYSAGEKHCDSCGPCFMRKVAFERNGLKDPVFI